MEVRCSRYKLAFFVFYRSTQPTFTLVFLFSNSRREKVYFAEKLLYQAAAFSQEPLESK